MKKKKTKMKIFRGELFEKSGFFGFLGKFRYVTSMLNAITLRDDREVKESCRN